MSSVTERAWAALHEPLRLFLRRRLPDEESVDDLLQEIFLRIHQHAQELRSDEKLEHWAYRIARHLVCDYYRRRRTLLPLEDQPQSQAATNEVLLRSEQEQASEVARAAIKRSLQELIRCLPAPYREALILTEYEGLSQRELARRLGLSFSGAKSRVQRARERLRQLLQACCQFEFDRLGRVIGYQPLTPCCLGPEESEQCSGACLDESVCAATSGR
ncbi:RNA polymerase sigma factor SigZ [Thermogemmatispora carboxidivorans]|uniref:RNA polymerase sigma factor SigZ n=1 Tax=Thermogemmatispora carboxidivorans TaxID=1382306 RepID=UPI00069CA4FF|nr:RNA polymerase sigma factor SigZ [Thermogemmatispora carboxidivorans]